MSAKKSHVEKVVIRSLTEQIIQALDHQEKVIAELSGNLDPVLIPDNPTLAKEHSPETAVRQNSFVAAELENILARVSSQTDSLASILDRSEV